MDVKIRKRSIRDNSRKTETGTLRPRRMRHISALLTRKGIKVYTF